MCCVTVIYIYILSSFTDGGYGVWTEWSDCTKSCGGGVKERDRACTNPFPSGGGKDCTSLGKSNERVQCNKQACKIGKYLLPTDVISFYLLIFTKIRNQPSVIGGF